MTTALQLPQRPMSSVGVDVRREGIDGSRWYCDPETQELYHSVTTVLGATASKPWLTAWAAKLAAEFAADQHDLISQTLTAAGREAAVDLIKGAAKRKREEASENGTRVHDVVEALVLDTPLPEFHSEAAEASAMQFIEWHIAWQPVYLMSECTVANPALGYAGTLDLVAYLPPIDKVYEIDVKNGANLDADMVTQLVAYARATEVWLPFAQKAPMPKVDGLAVLHLRPERSKFIDVTEQANNPAVFQDFLNRLGSLQHRDARPKHLGTVLYPPLADGSQPPPLLEDLEGAVCVNALADAGITRLDQLADCDSRSLLAIKGIGPKKVLALQDFLARHGMELSEATL